LTNALAYFVETTLDEGKKKFYNVDTRFHSFLASNSKKGLAVLSFLQLAHLFIERSDHGRLTRAGRLSEYCSSPSSNKSSLAAVQNASFGDFSTKQGIIKWRSTVPSLPFQASLPWSN
jgi:hypothetical protein